MSKDISRVGSSYATKFFRLCTSIKEVNEALNF